MARLPLFLLLSPFATCTTAQSGKKANIVWVLTDDQDIELGCATHAPQHTSAQAAVQQLLLAARLYFAENHSRELQRADADDQGAQGPR